MTLDIIRSTERQFIADHLGVWVYQLDTRQEEWSEGLSHVLEIGPAENRRLLSLFPGLKTQIHAAMQSNRSSWETELSLADPQRCFLMRLDFRKSPSDDSPCVVGTIQRSKRQAMATSNRTLKDILGAFAKSPGAVVFATDAEGLYTFLDGAGLEFLRMKAEEWLGRSVFEFLKDQPNLQAMIRRVFQGEIVCDESHFEEHYFMDRICPVYDSDETFQGIIGIQVNVTDKFHAERELQVKTDLLNNFFNSIPDNAYMLDLDYNVLQVNTAAKEMFSETTLTGLPCFRSIHGRETPCDFCPVSETYRTGEPAQQEYFEPSVGKYFELTSFPIRDQHTGRIVGATEIARDITRRKWMDESLLRNEKLLNDLMEILTEAVYLIDTGYTITRANKAANEMYPDLAPLVGKKCYDTTCYGRICPDCAAEAMFREGKATTRTFFEKNKDDEPGVWLELTAFPQYERGTDAINGAICILRDVTPRIHLESQLDEYRRQIQAMAEKQMQELRLSEAKLRSILETSSAAISFADACGRFSYVNGMFREMLGYFEEDVLGKPLTCVMIDDKEKRRQAEEEIKRALEGEYDHYRAVQEFLTREGKTIWGDVSVSMIRGSSPEETQAISVIVDVTAQQQLLEQLNRAKTAAEEASHAKSQFLATMSHEIRTPLNGVIGLSDLLMGTPLQAKQLEYAKLIKASGESLLFLINDILDFSKIEAGKFELEESAFDLIDLVESVLGILASRAEEKKLELVALFAPRVPRPVGGDPGRLRQVLINLVGNALKFTHEGGVTIHVSTVSLAAGQVEVRFSVSDTGIGIPRHRQDRLFRRFSQIDASSARLYGGTGLGLAICKKLVELMGGAIYLESVEGNGSTFWFTIPLSCDSAMLECFERDVPPCMTDGAVPCRREYQRCCPRTGRSLAFNREVAAQHRLKILVTGTGAIQRAALIEQLKCWGFQAATRPFDANTFGVLENAAENDEPFHLLLLDSVSGDLEYETLIRNIQESASLNHTAIICLTALSEDFQSRPWKYPERLRFISKPVYGAFLLDAIVGLFSEDASSGKKCRREENAMENSECGHAVLSRPVRVLVAEDNRINQIVISELLQKAGMDCLLVENGREVLEVIGREQIDIILMDCQMPLMDGYEATKQLRQVEREKTDRTGLPRRLPIIALTANATSEDEAKCLDAGMDAYCSKPIDPKRVLEMIRKWTAS